jgi:hypothetical protein
MLKFLYNLIQFLHIDPRVYELEKDIEFYQYILLGSIFVIILLIIIVYLQRRLVVSLRGGKPSKPAKKILEREKPTVATAGTAARVSPKELPDPGLIFKYSLAKENVKEKLITIGQLEGNIKTYSTEIIDNHLSIYIRIIENRRDKDIYDLPNRIKEEYQLDLRRDGKILIYYPGLEGFREMGSRERIYIKDTPDEAGDPTLPSIEAKSPIRFRLGDRLNQDGKFVSGYFEFHLFNQDYEVKTKAGIPKIEKNFLVRLYKIYPGYDTGSPTGDGLYPMVDPFTTG